MNHNLRFGSIFHAGAALSLLAALVVAPPSNCTAKPTSELVDNISVSGTAMDISSGTSSSLTGTAQITGIEFDSATQALIFEGNISGMVSADGSTTQILSQLFMTSGTLSSTSTHGSKCDVINVNLGQIDLNLLGLQVELSDIALDVAEIRGPGKLLGNRLCKLSHLFEDNAIDKVPSEVARINDIVGDSLTNISVVGTLETSGTFTGFLTVEGLSADGQGNIVFSGMLSGLAVSDGMTTIVASQAISTSGTISGSNAGGKGNKCSTVFLDLGIIDLGTLDLQVDLSEFALDIGAVKGSGSKVGKALCKLTRTLDKPGKPEKAAKKLEKAINKINRELLR